jgi:hypothetical protein
MAAREREPAVSMLFAGFFLASTLLGVRPETDHGGGIAARIPEPLRPGSESRSLDSMSARELRALPGIGPARAIAMASARWEHALSADPSNDPGAFGTVRGIGPETVRTLRAFLEAAANRDAAAQGRLGRPGRPGPVEGPGAGAYTSAGHPP